LVNKQERKDSMKDNETEEQLKAKETKTSDKVEAQKEDKEVKEDIELVEAEELDPIDDTCEAQEVTQEQSEDEEKETQEGIVNTFKNMFKDFKSKNQKLEQDSKVLHNQLDTFKDRLARTSAEYENYRKRSAKEKEGIYTDACTDVLKELLPVLDNLERALKIDANFEDLRKGIEITIKQYELGLEKLQVEEVKSDGEFNPNFHNAVQHIEDEEIGKNQIVEVFQKGYKRDDKILRYSMVKVAN